MGLKWTCDVTGKEVSINPKTEAVKDENGKVVMTTLKVQDASGKITVKQVPKVKYLEPKGHLIRLSVGDETIQRVLSDEALEPFKEKLQELYAALEALG